MTANRYLSFCIALACCAACTPSDLTADAGVTVDGTVVLPDGGPLNGAKLVLIKEPDLGEAVGGAFEVVTTLGLACLSSNPPALCEQGFTATTAANGSFSFSLTGAQTQGSIDDADTFFLSAQAAPQAGQVGGASVSEQFIINASDLALPDLRLWEPAVVFAATVTSASVTFDAVPADDGSNIQTGVTFTAATNGALVWSQAVQSGAAIDARILEDAQGTVAATATASGQATQTSVTFDYQSGPVAFEGSAGPAPSRAAACFVQGSAGPVAVTPCSLTDGDFGTAVQLQTCASCGSQVLNNWAYVDLGTARTISLVVVRGVQSPAVVEASADAMTWSSVSAGAETGSFSASASGSARYVRVRAQAATDEISGLTEISVW